MNKRLFKQAFTVSSIAVGAFYFGTLTERQRFVKNFGETATPDINHHHQEGHTKDINNHAHSVKLQIEKKPGLPIFGTVSAAVPVPADEVAVAATPSRVSQIMKYGFPSLDHVRSYSDHVLSYDRRNRVPNWVFEHLTRESIAKNQEVNRSRCEFRPDESIHPFFRSHNTDYMRTGFDRGHMAAAANHRRHQQHCDDTFYLSNIAPQVGQGFNRDAWNRLEMYVRGLAYDYANVYICTGPLYLPRKEEDGKTYVKYQVIGANTVAVPTHFYKVVVCETNDKQLEMEAYVMPNKAISDDTPLEVFRVPPESVERSAGLLFFDKIDRKQLTKINGKKV